MSPSDSDLSVIFHAGDLEPAPPSPPITGWLEPLLLRAMDHCGVASGCIEVSLVDDAIMAALHQQHCGDPSTTDVLTFDMRHGTAPPDGADADQDHVEGDLILCVDEAARQAAARRHELRVELLLYAVHGLLHLLGEDDHDDDGYERMHRREDQLLQQLGIGAVFAAGQGEDPMLVAGSSRREAGR